MQFKTIFQCLNFWLIVTTIGCTEIKRYFPDKTKDYQFEKEIPVLNIPPNLIQNPEIFAISDTGNTNIKPIENKQQANYKKTKSYIELIESPKATAKIYIQDSLEQSWHKIGKALSRNSIEIIQRNVADKIYLVQYDANFKRIQDGSLRDEIRFIFADDPAQEKVFKIKLVLQGYLTEVMVLTDSNTALARTDGLKLLRLLYDTIKQNKDSSK